MYGERGGEVRSMERVTWKLTTHKTDNQQEFAVCLGKLKQGLCINLEGGRGSEMGGRFRREGRYMSLWLTHVQV